MYPQRSLAATLYFMRKLKWQGRSASLFCLYEENPALCAGFSKAYSFGHVSKTPFDLLKGFAVWQLRVNKSKGGHDV